MNSPIYSYLVIGTLKDKEILGPFSLNVDAQSEESAKHNAVEILKNAGYREIKTANVYLCRAVNR